MVLQVCWVAVSAKAYRLCGCVQIHSTKTHCCCSERWKQQRLHIDWFDWLIDWLIDVYCHCIALHTTKFVVDADIIIAKNTIKYIYIYIYVQSAQSIKSVPTTMQSLLKSFYAQVVVTLAFWIFNILQVTRVIIFLTFCLLR